MVAEIPDPPATRMTAEGERSEGQPSCSSRKDEAEEEEEPRRTRLESLQSHARSVRTLYEKLDLLDWESVSLLVLERIAPSELLGEPLRVTRVALEDELERMLVLDLRFLEPSARGERKLLVRVRR